jgi:hypothetical protein
MVEVIAEDAMQDSVVAFSPVALSNEDVVALLARPRRRARERGVMRLGVAYGTKVDTPPLGDAPADAQPSRSATGSGALQRRRTGRRAVARR